MLLSKVISICCYRSKYSVILNVRFIEGNRESFQRLAITTLNLFFFRLIRSFKIFFDFIYHLYFNTKFDFTFLSFFDLSLRAYGLRQTIRSVDRGFL